MLCRLALIPTDAWKSIFVFIVASLIINKDFKRWTNAIGLTYVCFMPDASQEISFLFHGANNCYALVYNDILKPHTALIIDSAINFTMNYLIHVDELFPPLEAGRGRVGNPARGDAVGSRAGEERQPCSTGSPQDGVHTRGPSGDDRLLVGVSSRVFSRLKVATATVLLINSHLPGLSKYWDSC